MRVLITGGTGFIGAPLARALHDKGHTVTVTSRRALNHSQFPHIHHAHVVSALDAGTDWSAALEGQDAVVHLAARTHVMKETAADPLKAYRAINVAATRRLAEQAAQSGVTRLVFMSSIKVNGEETGKQGLPARFQADDAPAPQDAYGQSKHDAEKVLQQVSDATGLEHVILRPPLVYGPGVKGNFLSLLKLCDKAVPLPLGSVRNARSLICTDNLVSAVAACLEKKKAAGRTYLVHDGEDISTPNLIRALGAALDRPVRLFAFPLPLLHLTAALLGKGDKIRRLTGSLVIDDTPIRKELNWSPAVTLADGLERTALWYKSLNQRP